MRLVILFVLLGLLLAISFLIWGEGLESFFTAQNTVDWLKEFKGYGWAVAIGLLISDLLLPIPASGIMTALGMSYGPLLGGLIAFIGSFLAGTLGYTATRLVGDRAALFIVGEKDMERGKKLFDQYGGFAVAASRMLPIFPEAIACLAGLTRMKALPFFLALTAGSLPMSFTYATLGYYGQNHPILTLSIGVGLPIALYSVFHYLLKRSSREPEPAKSE